MADKDKVSKKDERDYKQFLIDIVQVMDKHNVDSMLVALFFRDHFRNTTIGTGTENEVLEMLSDGIAVYLQSKIDNQN